MTYSIVALDPETGELGAAAATALPAVGALVPHVRSGVGAVATQGWATNPFYGPDGLDLLEGGTPADTALAAVTQGDTGREQRQAIMVDASGRSASWTGAGNVESRGAICEKCVAVAGNMLSGGTVLPDMLSAFLAAGSRPLAERLLAALAAADAAGGDMRGASSSALLVDGGRGYPDIDLRVDDHERPIEELTRLLKFWSRPEIRDFLERLPERRRTNPRGSSLGHVLKG